MSFQFIPTRSRRGRRFRGLIATTAVLVLANGVPAMAQPTGKAFTGDPGITLRVVHSSGEFENLTETSGAEHPGRYQFDWSTEYDDIVTASWVVTTSGRDLGAPLAHGRVGHIPNAGKHSRFSIDFVPIVDNDATRPLHYAVRVKFRRGQGGIMGTIGPEAYSPPVTIIVTGPR